MKNKAILILAGSLLTLILLFIYFTNSRATYSKIAVRSIDENKIYVGDEKPGLESASDEASSFAKTVEGLNEGWDNIGTGESYYRAGQYEEAVKAYKKAYDVDPGNRTLSGNKLINVYEKLSRYDEAIALVDEILKTQPLVEYGIAKFTAIRTRLLAAKVQSAKAE